MSEVTIESLQAELATAKGHVKQLADNIKGLVAQLEASKQMLNEQLASNLHIRTNLQIFGNANKEYLENEARLNSIIAELNKKVDELTPKPE